MLGMDVDHARPLVSTATRGQASGQAEARKHGTASRAVTMLGMYVDHVGPLVSTATSCWAAGQAEAGMLVATPRAVTMLGKYVDHVGPLVSTATTSRAAWQAEAGIHSATSHMVAALGAPQVDHARFFVVRASEGASQQPPSGPFGACRRLTLTGHWESACRTYGTRMKISL